MHNREIPAKAAPKRAGSCTPGTPRRQKPRHRTPTPSLEHQGSGSNRSTDSHQMPPPRGSSSRVNSREPPPIPLPGVVPRNIRCNRSVNAAGPPPPEAINPADQEWRRMRTPVAHRGQHIVMTACGNWSGIHRTKLNGSPLSFSEYVAGYNKLVFARYNRDRTEMHARDTESLQYLERNPLEFGPSRWCLPHLAAFFVATCLGGS